MQTPREKAKTGREKLALIIETCRTVEERSLDPFLVDIKENIGTMKQYFPEWKAPEDLVLDAETLHRLASVVRLQSDWVKHRSTSLYTDPFLLEEKLRQLPKEAIIDTFAQAWHPIIAMEQISIHSLAEAMTYWINLLPMDERWKEPAPEEVQVGNTTREELIKEKILRDQAFSEELENFWQQLKTEVQQKGENGRIHYWDFIGAKTYEETVQKAFMTSFLLTYGFATLQIYPLEEEMYIKPNEEPETKIGSKQLVSIPIAVSVEDWTKWKKDEQR